MTIVTPLQMIFLFPIIKKYRAKDYLSGDT